MSIYEKIVKDFEKYGSKLTLVQLYEIIYFPIFAILFFIFEFQIIHLNGLQEIFQKYEFQFIFSFFGLFHILASNILAYLYNLQRTTLFIRFLPMSTPKRLRIFGCLLIIASLLSIAFNNL